MSNVTIATGTPVVSVSDNRGVMVRTLNWNREQASDPLRLLVSHSLLHDDSRMMESRDPRLFTVWSTDSTAMANLCSTPSLAGEVLRRESTDSGWQVVLFDAAGRPVWMTDGRGTVQSLSYDELGRPQNGSEQLSSGEVRASWRNEYGDAGATDDGSQDNNLRGVCVSQYDDGGLHRVNSVALSGAVQSGSQQFLTSAEALPDWPDAEADRQGLLETAVYTTTTTVDARGAPLGQTDAAGHQQMWRYNVNGNIRQQSMTVAASEKQTLLESVTWSADGQVLEERAGNGVTTTYTYEPETQWLSAITAQRADSTVLQALGYGYDNTGNVTSLSDGTVASRYYRNQATDGVREFGYDALYQLLNATGRENATSTGMPYSSLPAMVQMDSSQYVNYTRTYRYDDSGNLQTLTHAGAGNFTRTMTTETTSNRSVQKNDGGAQTADEVANWFDSNGNLQQLQAGSPPSGSSSAAQNGLVWDGRNHLQSVTLVSRSSTDMRQNDREVYQYSGSSRVRKQTRTLVNSGTGLWNVDEVRYLAGMELRRSWQETVSSSTVTPGAVTEELHVLSGQAGRAGIRGLHWATGKPEGIDNDQVRWSVDDNIGSLSLELDSEGQVISREEYYPFGGTAVWSARSEVEAEYKVVRYSGKERDGTGLYDYGHRYYAPWLCRWVSADPAGEVDGLNLFRMVQNNPVSFSDYRGLLKVGEAARKEVGEKFITPLHMAAIEDVSRQGRMAFSFREAGVQTIAALQAGQAAKGHNILEKTIKLSSVTNVYGEKDAENVMDSAKESNLAGSVAHWPKPRRSVDAIYVHNNVSNDDMTIPANLRDSKAQDLLQAWNKFGTVVTYTGDYDMHDIIIFDREGRGHIPVADSEEEESVKDKINIAVANIDSNRPFEAEHMNVIRHGPQVNFTAHMMNHELNQVVKMGGYLGVVAHPGPFPVAMVVHGEWQILENEKELYDFYKSYGVELPPHWGENPKTPLLDRGKGIVATQQDIDIINSTNRHAL